MTEAKDTNILNTDNRTIIYSEEQRIRDEIWAEQDFIRCQIDRENYYKREIAIRDAKIAECDALIAQKDAAIAKLDALIADKEAAIAKVHALIADKNAGIVDQDTANAKASAILADLKDIFQQSSDILKANGITDNNNNIAAKDAIIPEIS